MRERLPSSSARAGLARLLAVHGQRHRRVVRRPHHPAPGRARRCTRRGSAPALGCALAVAHDPQEARPLSSPCISFTYASSSGPGDAARVADALHPHQLNGTSGFLIDRQPHLADAAVAERLHAPRRFRRRSRRPIVFSSVIEATRSAVSRGRQLEADRAADVVHAPGGSGLAPACRIAGVWPGTNRGASGGPGPDHRHPRRAGLAPARPANQSRHLARRLPRPGAARPRPPYVEPGQLRSGPLPRVQAARFSAARPRGPRRVRSG